MSEYKPRVSIDPEVLHMGEVTVTPYHDPHQRLLGWVCVGSPSTYDYVALNDDGTVTHHRGPFGSPGLDEQLG